MAIRDLREWLHIMKQKGEVLEVNGACLEDEIGVITDLYQRRPGSRALLFDEIPGYPKGHRILSNPLASYNRLATTLGLPHESLPMDIVAAFREVISGYKLVPPVWVKDGHVTENVISEDSINLFSLPAPKWHEDDGGRYIGTGCMVLLRDPENPNWVNSGTYRIMVHDARHLGIMISPGKHGDMILQKYRKKNQACPICIVLGMDPLLYLVSGMEVPFEVSEYDFAGWIRKAPIELMNGPITGLPIPANAELVLEGEINPGEERLEGPFGEWTGYYAGGRKLQPVITVKTILHRNNPIIVGSAPAMPPSDESTWRSPIRSAIIWNQLVGAGIPGVKGVWVHESGAGRFLVIVSIEQLYGGHSRQAGLVASQCHGGAYANRWVMVVDEDVDITNIEEVLWAALTRCDPGEDLEIIRKCWSTRLDPLSYPGETPFNNRMVMDACRSYDRRHTFPKVARSSSQSIATVVQKWARLFPVQ